MGKSPCCSVWGDNDCRTIQVKGKTDESIPESLITKASLLAASDLVSANPELQFLSLKK